jgi:hypothetical protein
MNISSGLRSSALDSIRTQAFASLLGSDADYQSLFSSALSASGTSATMLLDSIAESKRVGYTGKSNGRNWFLPDPESAYRMMSLINEKDVLYKAQYAELSQMGSYVTRLGKLGSGMAEVTDKTSDADIRSALQDFVGQYNDWTTRFGSDLDGGMLAGTQAAQVARYELEQSVKNRFFGVTQGVGGLTGLGIEVDAQSRLTLDDGKLEAALGSNRAGVVAALRDFGTNFAKSASLLNAQDNFIPNQLANLHRAIQFIDANRASLKAEFGSGDPAKPSRDVAQALAAYQRMA